MAKESYISLDSVTITFYFTLIDRKEIHDNLNIAVNR